MKVDIQKGETTVTLTLTEKEAVALYWAIDTNAISKNGSDHKAYSEAEEWACDVESGLGEALNDAGIATDNPPADPK